MQSEASTWTKLVSSIRSHRAYNAKFFKPVCVICAIDLADEGELDALRIDPRKVENRFRRYVGVIHPERADQAWKPLWHLSSDGLWCFYDGERLIDPEDFGPVKKPAGRTQLMDASTHIAISDRYVEDWATPVGRADLRKQMLVMLAQDDPSSRPFARQLALPGNALNPEAWPSEEELPDLLDIQFPLPDLFGNFGVEEDGSEREDRIHEPFDPETIQMETKSVTVDLILSRVSTNRIDLQPDFQRRVGIWDQRRQSRLIESMLLRIPLPVIYAAEDDEERWEIVDGIQRLTTIARFIKPETVGMAPLRLTDLEYLQDFEGWSFEDLSERMKLRLRETELGVNIIKKQTPPEVKYNIFARINSGGVVLTAQELRHAITPGPIRILLEKLATSDAFVKATDGSIRPDRMADRELVLRYLAFRVLGVQSYRHGDMDGFLLKAMRAINRLDERGREELEREFTVAMHAASLIFGNDAFRKRSSAANWRHPVNKGLFETVGVNLVLLSNYQVRHLESVSVDVRQGLMRLCSDRGFDAAISQGTSDVTKVNRRFSEVARLFLEFSGAH
jgi:hypothetical protein